LLNQTLAQGPAECKEGSDFFQNEGYAGNWTGVPMRMRQRPWMALRQASTALLSKNVQASRPHREALELADRRLD